MRHLFSPEGERALTEVLRLQPLLAFDFDGTLAPIVARPDDARVPAPISKSLTQLALHLPVAVVTGRAVNDVGSRLGFTPHHVIGNHGAEDPAGQLAPGSLQHLGPCRQHLAMHAAALLAVGVTVEDKHYSLALHYRLSRDQAAARALIETLLPDMSEGLHIFHGKCVVNLAPADSPDKGDAVVALLARSGAGAAVFMGDDLNDEPVFERAEAHWLTVRIGREIASSRAQFFLDAHVEVATLLQRMLLLLKAG